MNGGIVRGGTLENQGTIGGYGTLRSNDLINNAAISAEDGQTLVIDTIGSPDLDGLGTPAAVAGHLLEAVHGNVTITKTPGDAFGATLTIGAGRAVTFMGGWTLDAPGTLNMTGATLAGSSAILRGTVNVTDQCHCLAPALFAAGSATSLAANATLRLESTANVEAAAAFSGAGRLVVANGSTLTLAPAANVGVSLVNESGRIELATGPGLAKAAEFTQTAAGTLAVEILGAPASTDWDQLTVTGTAALDGTLEVTFNVAGAQPGDTWKVLSAGSLTGGFSQLTVLGLPAGYKLLMLPTANAVYLKLSALLTYADWALAAGLTPLNNDVSADPDGDELENGLEMFLGGNPLKPDFSLMPLGGIVKVEGLRYLAITLPVAVDTTPSDLKLGVLRSTDLSVWKQEDTVIEVTGYDPEQCLEFRRFRSAIPFDPQPREYLKLHVTAQ